VRRPQEVEFFVEFPRGPLSIGDDLAIHPVRLTIGGVSTFALSPTDSCRDRLAAFYHWDDRQSLCLAVEIACKHKVNLDAIRAWSVKEGMAAKCREFLREVADPSADEEPRA
jgi:hypothetical protein